MNCVRSKNAQKQLARTSLERRRRIIIIIIIIIIIRKPSLVTLCNITYTKFNWYKNKTQSNVPYLPSYFL